MHYEFIESSLFSRMVYDYLSEDDYTAFQQFLLEHPEAGDVVQGSGGVRKVRWARAGTGKSGGVRVCYYTQCSRANSAFGHLCQKRAGQHSWRGVETN